MIWQEIANITADAIEKLYNQKIDPKDIQVQKTRKEFEGDLTVVVFSLTRLSKKSPEITAKDIGDFLISNTVNVSSFSVVKGFLNLVIREDYWIDFLNREKENCDYAFKRNNDGAPFVIEFSSPNTNKPLHLGHIRNNLLGWSVSKIIAAGGKKVVRVNLVNDRGIHICKSMLAYEKWGKGETPESSGMKGDKLVGKYYVLFDKQYKKEIDQLTAEGTEKDMALRTAPLILEAQEMLKRWEEGDEKVMALWKTMNSWVYRGFDSTYNSLGISFDKIYYESETYRLGKDIIEKGLSDNVLTKRPNGSVWIDLTGEGLDEKLLLRADGTSVYITQDLGTARLRHEEYKAEKMIYVVGNEQNYHFDVLAKTLKKLGYGWADSIYHLSYGMVELPEGKMKSREGSVVDADDLIDEMIATAKQMTTELGKAGDFSEEEAENLFRMIGLGALKYFILKVDPEKNMLFNPKESIDFDGNTGPFIQYTHARICSLLKRSGNFDISKPVKSEIKMLNEEKEIVKLIHDFPLVLNEASESLSPALIANYIYELTRNYNTFYQKVPVLKEKDTEIVHFRLVLSYFTGNVIKMAMDLLGIEVPERM